MDSESVATPKDCELYIYLHSAVLCIFFMAISAASVHISFFVAMLYVFVAASGVLQG